MYLWCLGVCLGCASVSALGCSFVLFFLEQVGIDARSKGLVSGYLAIEPTLVYLDNVLSNELASGSHTPLYKVRAVFIRWKE